MMNVMKVCDFLIFCQANPLLGQETTFGNLNRRQNWLHCEVVEPHKRLPVSQQTSG